jgi:hypothetical protein
MNEQHEEVNGVEICNWCVETGGKRPRKSHQQIATEMMSIKHQSYRKVETRTSNWDAVTFPTNRK